MSNEPLTQEDLDKMDFDKVWMSYGPEPDNGEWALVYNGLLYSIDDLEGAGFEGILNDLMRGDALDNPSGTYRVYRFSLRELRTLSDSPLTLEQLRGMDGKPAYWPEVESWGIISVEGAGKWAGIPFFCGRKLGVNFQYNIESRGMEVYASPPAHIYREAWKPCENCLSCGNCSEAGTDADDYPCAECISDHAPNGLLQASMRHFHPVGFCRFCGRPLTPDAWTKLENRLKG